MVRARAVLARPLHVVGEPPGIGYAFDHLLVHRVGLHLELVLHVHRAGGDECVDAPPPRRPDRLGAALDVHPGRPGKAADDRCAGGLGDLVHRLEVAVRGDGEPRLDDVDAHFLEDLGDAQLLVQVHGGARRLLAVAERGIEDDDPVGILAVAHGTKPSFIQV